MNSRQPAGQPAGQLRQQLGQLATPRQPALQSSTPRQPAVQLRGQPAGQPTAEQLNPGRSGQQLSPRHQAKQQPGMPVPQGDASSNAPPQQSKAPQAQVSLNKRQPVMRIRLEDVEIDKTVKLLGKGTFGMVYKGRLRSDHRKVAVKMMEKTKLQQLKVPREDVMREVDMMMECAGDTCNVKDRFVQMFDFIETANKYYLVMEFCENGNLQDAAMSSKAGLGEQHVRMLIKQMLEAIVFLHAEDICHRDVKPHNFLVCGNINSTSVKIKLGDFGEAIRLKKGKLLKNQVGTPAFMAPEMHLLPARSNGYDHKVDVWALGICMVFLLASEYPFIDGSGRLLRNKLIQGDLPLWDANTFEGLFNGLQEAVGIRRRRPSGVAIHLTRRLLAPRRQDRPGASEAMRHDWFHKAITDDGEGDALIPLLDMKDFQIGFATMEHEFPSAPPPSGKVKPGINSKMPYAAPSDARSPTCHQRPVTTSSPSASDVRPVTSFGQSWSTVASLGDLPQQWPKVQRSLSEQAHPRTFSGDLDFGKSFSTPYTPQARRSISSDFGEVRNFGVSYTPEPVQRRMSSHDEAVALANRSACCFVCKRPSSMLDHLCPLCNSSVCAECIRKHLAKDPHCPCCKDRDHNVQNFQMILSAHKARDALRTFWGSITGTA